MLLLVCGLLPAPGSYSAQSEEPQLKAVFVLNFAKLAEWPADSYSDNKTFSIAILGKAPSAAFINVLKDQTVRGARVTVKYVDNVRQAKDSQLLYISDSERQSLAAVLKEIRHISILTVSDMPGFCEAGGMIGLVTVKNRLSFGVNLAAVRKARLAVDSQLLKLAKVLYGQ